MQTSLVQNASANHMSIKIASVPDCVFVPTIRACSLISSFKDVAATLTDMQTALLCRDPPPPPHTHTISEPIPQK